MNIKFNKIILITILGLSQNCFADANQQSVSLTLKSVTKTVDSLCEIRKEDSQTVVANNDEVSDIPFVINNNNQSKPTEANPPRLKIYYNTTGAKIGISDLKTGGLTIQGIGFIRDIGGSALDLTGNGAYGIPNGSFELAPAKPLGSPITLTPMFIVESMDKLVEGLKSGDYNASVGITLTCHN